MKYIAHLLLCLSLTPVRVVAEEAVVQTFPAYTLADQHGKEHTLRPETRTVIMCFDMEMSKSIHEWLSEKDADYLRTHQTEYVADISPMPAVVLKLFAGPKMRKFKFPILLATSKTFAADYPHEEGNISVFSLAADQKSATVTLVKTIDELKALLDSPSPDTSTE